MKYTYNTMKARVVSLRSAGKSVDEIEAATGIGAGEVRLMTREALLPANKVAALLARRNATKRKRPA